MSGIVSETIGRIFGTEKAAAALIDNVASGLDKLAYTGEEKADVQATAVTEARQMVIKWLEATSGQNLARRLLALMITAVWLGQYVCMMMLSVIAVLVTDPAPFVDASKVMGACAETMNSAVMLILAFYFASPYMGSIVNAAVTQFSGKK